MVRKTVVIATASDEVAKSRRLGLLEMVNAVSEESGANCYLSEDGSIVVEVLVLDEDEAESFLAKAVQEYGPCAAEAVWEYPWG